VKQFSICFLLFDKNKEGLPKKGTSQKKGKKAVKNAMTEKLKKEIHYAI